CIGQAHLRLSGPVPYCPGRLLSDHQKEAAFSAALDDLARLDEEVVQFVARGRTGKQWAAVQIVVQGHYRRNAADKFQAAFLEPAQNLANRVFRLVRMMVLIGKPGAALGSAEMSGTQVPVE